MRFLKSFNERRNTISQCDDIDNKHTINFTTISTSIRRYSEKLTTTGKKHQHHSRLLFKQPKQQQQQHGKHHNHLSHHGNNNNMKSKKTRSNLLSIVPNRKRKNDAKKGQPHILTKNKNKHENKLARSNIVSKLVKLRTRFRSRSRLVPRYNEDINNPPIPSISIITRKKKAHVSCDSFPSPGSFDITDYDYDYDYEEENENNDNENNGFSPSFSSSPPIIYGGVDYSDSYEEHDNHYYQDLMRSTEVSELNSVCTLDTADNFDNNNNDNHDLLGYSGGTHRISILSLSQNKYAMNNGNYNQRKNTQPQQLDESSSKYRIKFSSLTSITSKTNNAVNNNLSIKNKQDDHPEKNSEDNNGNKKKYPTGKIIHSTTPSNEDDIIISSKTIQWRRKKHLKHHHCKHNNNRKKSHHHNNEEEKQTDYSAILNLLFSVSAVELYLFLFLAMLLRIENPYTIRSIIFIITIRAIIYILDPARVSILYSPFGNIVP